VLEETGFDVSELLDKDEYLEVIFGQQRVRLYIIAGVNDGTSFAPLTKKEISVGEIAWQRLDDLHSASDEVISRSVTGLKLYMVTPFLKSLRTWISKHAPPAASKSDAFHRGFTVWKAKNSSFGNNVTLVDSQQTKPVPDAPGTETSPGKSLRNFSFETTSILRAMESKFSN
ncbi:mRNA-decapping enzyme subunit 2, partial [Bienertia sinuspersici]